MPEFTGKLDNKPLNTQTVSGTNTNTISTQSFHPSGLIQRATDPSMPLNGEEGQSLASDHWHTGDLAIAARASGQLSTQTSTQSRI
ncbi:MAG: hypothetical protein AAF639_45415 [Chloroflexota bacterium]